MQSRWLEAWRAELPEVSRSQARTLVVALGLFWGSYALAIPGLYDGSGIALMTLLVGFAAGWRFYLVLVRVWGTRLFVWPGRGYFAEHWKQMAALMSLFRPTFIGRVFRATGWPPVVVGIALMLLFVVAMRAGLTTPESTR